MASYWGKHIHISVFGQSHAPAIGVTVDGLPAGEAVDLDKLQTFLRRRAPGRDSTSTPRKEGDRAGDLVRAGGGTHLRGPPGRRHPQHQYPLQGLQRAAGQAPPPPTPTTPPR